MGFLKRNLKIKSQKVKEHAYKTLVRPKLEYSSSIWDPHTKSQINQIEKVQRRAARYITNRYHNTSSVTNIMQTLKLPSLEIRRTRCRLIMFYKIIHNIVAINPPPNLHLTKEQDTVAYIHTELYKQTKTHINTLFTPGQLASGTYYH